MLANLTWPRNAMRVFAGATWKSPHASMMATKRR